MLSKRFEIVLNILDNDEGKGGPWHLGPPHPPNKKKKKKEVKKI
jgi:hypothetical protein